VSLDSWAERPPARPDLMAGPVRGDSQLVAAPPGEPTSVVSPAIHVIDLSKSYRRTRALHGLSMTVERGEIFGFLGPNGAGKTTTVKLLLGLARPSGGEAMVLGAPAGDVETRRRIGYLPELFRFQAWLTGAEVLTFHCRLLQLPTHTHHEFVRQAIEVVGLAERANDKVANFSKGMQQRLGLAVALLGDPDLVVLDEPTSALDPVGRHDVREIIRSIKARGATVFLNTHLLGEAEQVCDRVCVIDHGRSVATGSLSEMLDSRTSLRLKVGGLPGAWWTTFSSFGHWTSEGEWLRLDCAHPGTVPDVVAAIVARGGRIEAVVPEHQSLEGRFLELLGGPDLDSGHDTQEAG
jgi:ABC-2 type transport system ATP-binding protein